MATQTIDSGSVFTNEQLKSHFKVYAGPGAGKTHFIVQNIKNIVNSNPKIKNANNRKILCITYTNAAVNEIVSRLEGFSKYVHVCTIHSFIIDYIIKPYQNELKKIILSDFCISVSKKSFITSQVEGLGILHGIDKDTIYEWLNKKSGANDNLNYGKKIMGEVGIDLKKFIEDEKVKCFKSSSRIESKHIKLIKEYIWGTVNKLTHDEILYFGYRMAVLNSLITYALRVQFPFIFVDEFQDTNPIQTKLIKHLGETGTIVGVIGDRAQSIYSFQGAVPQEFSDFDINNSIKNYTIVGNRRSTEEIINLCNYLRRDDEELIQKNCKNANHKKVVFLCGDNNSVRDVIKEVITGDGAVLTRTWAAAFKYIIDINDEQADILRKIYNLYYPTSIDIRKEISEHNHIEWVRALRFVVSLQQALNSKSLPDLLKTFSYCINLELFKNNGGITPKNILYIKDFLDALFGTIQVNKTSVTEVFNSINRMILQPEYNKVKEILELGGIHISSNELLINYISEYDDKLIPLLEKLSYSTGVKLFIEVFSEQSKYMTVHQAKGREFDKVFVSVEPTQGDKAGSFLTTFLSTDIIGSEAKHEFARIIYVACSRAINELYIHVANSNPDLISSALNAYSKENDLAVFYEFK